MTWRISSTAVAARHIGDQADRAFAIEIDAFVQFLCDPHRSLRIEAKLARGFLLQRRCRERRRWVAASLAFLDADGFQCAIRRAENGLLDLARRRLVLETELLHLVALVGNEPCQERLFFLADVCLDRPVLARLERLDLKFALDDHSERRALHAAGTESALHFLPQQRRQVEADQVIECATRLLRTDEITR